MKFEWETIDVEKQEITQRAKVIGGWIIKHRDISGTSEVTNTMVFIPDPHYNWVID